MKYQELCCVGAVARKPPRLVQTKNLRRSAADIWVAQLPLADSSTSAWASPLENGNPTPLKCSCISGAKALNT